MKHSGLKHLAQYLVFLMLSVPVLAAAPEGDYHLITKYTLGGGAQYDYITIDASNRRLYISHGAHVNVVAVDNGVVVGDIPGMHVVAGTALVKELGRGFLSDGPADRVVIFDLQTLKVLGEVKTGRKPDCIIYDPASRHIFTFNGAGKDSTVIDPETGTVIGSIAIGGKLEYAVADGKGMVYVNNEDASEVVAIDSHALTIKARWPVSPAATPASMAMDLEHRRLFIGGRNKVLAIMDADNGNVIQSFPIGAKVDANVYEPETSLLFCTTGEGTVHIFHEDAPDKFSVVQTLHTLPGARTMALDPKTHNIFMDTVDTSMPPAPTGDNPEPPQKGPKGTFVLLVYGR